MKRKWESLMKAFNESIETKNFKYFDAEYSSQDVVYITKEIISILESKQKILLDSIQHLICKVNKVTCPHRHHNTVLKKDLDELSNCQIEIEKTIKDFE